MPTPRIYCSCAYVSVCVYGCVVTCCCLQQNRFEGFMNWALNEWMENAATNFQVNMLCTSIWNQGIICATPTLIFATTTNKQRVITPILGYFYVLLFACLASETCSIVFERPSFNDMNIDHLPSSWTIFKRVIIVFAWSATNMSICKRWHGVCV